MSQQSDRAAFLDVGSENYVAGRPLCTADQDVVVHGVGVQQDVVAVRGVPAANHSVGRDPGCIRECLSESA